MGCFADLDTAALIFYYGAVLITSREATVNNVMTVVSMLLFSIGYVSTVLSWGQ